MNAATASRLRFLEAGFTLVRHNKHPIWRCPCGHAQVTGDSSPGEGRAHGNGTARIARILRACKTLRERQS